MRKNKNEFKIGNKLVGEGQQAFIVAELSANHLQKYDLAVKTIKAIKKAGADAVKLQTFTPESITLNPQSLTLKNLNSYFKKKSKGLWKGLTSYELFKKAYMPWQWQPKLKKLAESLDLICFSTPFDHEAVEFLDKINVAAYKIASPEITDIPLIENIALRGKPVIISTGIATLKEIGEAVNACQRKKNLKIALLKCNPVYPSPLDEINLRAIPTLKKKFNTIVGLSDHSLSAAVAVGAVVLGASIVEKHFILKRDLVGPDAAFSLEPEEFSQMVNQIREVEKALGSGKYILIGKTKKERECRRSLYAVKDIKKGETFSKDNIRSIRPAGGLQPKYLKKIFGKKVKKNIKKGMPLKWSFIK